MQYSKEIFEQFDKVYIVGYVLRELERNKHSINEEKKYLSRRACRDIEANRDKVVYFVSENKYDMPECFDKDIVDNRIISNMRELCVKDNEIIALSNDILFRFTCESIDIICEKFGNQSEDVSEKYNGIKEVFLTERDYVRVRDSEINQLDCFPNEYVIINNTTKDEQYLYMWNGEYLEEVKVKPITNKYLGTKDAVVHFDLYQKAFIHMLQNENVKIMITDSIYGAGKSYIMLHWALQQLGSNNNGRYSKMYFVKSDSPPDNRKPYPAIPGGILEKSEGILGVLCDTTSEDSISEFMNRNNKIEVLPIQFAKSRSLQNSILFITEAQDFTPSEMERLLSRIGDDTVVLLDGSTRQIDNRYCKYRNGLTIASENFKNKSNAAQVNMIVDYRSDISKMISEMDWHD